MASVVLEPAEVTLDIGDTQPFQVELLDEFGNQIRDALISWKASADVGTIDADGLFEAGTTAGQYAGAVQLQVVKGMERVGATADVSILPDPLNTMSLQPAWVVLDSGTTQQFTATGSDQYGNEIPGLAFLWDVTEGEITQEGLYTAGAQSGLFEVNVSASYRDAAGFGVATTEVYSWSWWPGDGNARDVIGGNDGTLKKGASYGTGRIGQAFRFDGRNDYVEVPDSTILDITDQITIDFWMKRARMTVDQIEEIVDKGDCSPQVGINSGYSVRLSHSRDVTNAGAQGTGLINWMLDGVSWIQSAKRVDDGGYHHIAVTYDSATGAQRIYIDGQLDVQFTVRGRSTDHHE